MKQTSSLDKGGMSGARPVRAHDSTIAYQQNKYITIKRKSKFNIVYATTTIIFRI